MGNVFNAVSIYMGYSSVYTALAVLEKICYTVFDMYSEGFTGLVQIVWIWVSAAVPAAADFTYI